MAIAELCRSEGHRDLLALGRVADRLAALAVAPLAPRLAVAFGDLAVLHPPLFTALAGGLLGARCAPVPLARALARQRFRHEELLTELAEGLEDLRPLEALSLLHSFAFLRFGLKEELWRRLEGLVRLFCMLCHG